MWSAAPIAEAIRRTANTAGHETALRIIWTDGNQFTMGRRKSWWWIVIWGVSKKIGPSMWSQEEKKGRWRMKGSLQIQEIMSRAANYFKLFVQMSGVIFFSILISTLQCRLTCHLSLSFPRWFQENAVFLSWLTKVKGDDFRGCSDLFWSRAPLLWNFVLILFSLFRKIFQRLKYT